MRIDLRGAMLGCKHAIPHMIDGGGGSIVSTASNQGLAGDLTQSAYSCAKAGVVQLMRMVATQYGHLNVAGQHRVAGRGAHARVRARRARRRSWWRSPSTA